MYNVEKIIDRIKENLDRNFSSDSVNAKKIHESVVDAIMEEIFIFWKETKNTQLKVRRAYYFSAEFLMGRAIFNNLVSLGIYDEIKKFLEMRGYDIASLEEISDAALGNGGLGRLAACFLDSASTLKIPLDGYGIRYRYGLFKQIFKDGYQKEEKDDWNSEFDPWSVRQEEDTVEVVFKDQTVNAVPYDMPVIGYKNGNINTLRLWQAESKEKFDFEAFNSCRYEEAFRKESEAELISAVLYPNDETYEGKKLRLKQQYFFCSASLQDILKRFKKECGLNFVKFAEKTAIQLNDTHPVISIVELIRILCEQENVSFEDALDISRKVFSYTNHTVMSEAMEKWDISLIKEIIPNVYLYLEKVEENFKKTMQDIGLENKILNKIDIIKDNKVHMANLAIYCSSYVNGVSEIHTNILKESCLKDWYKIYPDRFQNKTNGITPRRWLLVSNPELSNLITSLLKTDRWILDLYKLKELKKFSQDEKIIREFIKIKKDKKRQLIDYIKKYEGVFLDETTIFDVQIKRLHEYKRQLLNILAILYIYFKIKAGEIKDFYPTTFLFGAKAAPGYKAAKQIIKLINTVADFIEKDSDVSRLIKVFFVQNYNVSYAEKIIPAADVSVQISLVGTEASGTGNMKFMLNGAVTLGTYDGANIEIVNEAGKENNYIFGNTKEEIDRICSNYNPIEIYEENEGIKKVIDSLTDGTLGRNLIFKDIKDSLLKNLANEKPDRYYILADFESYVKERLKLNKDYRNSLEFYKKCWNNVAGAGKFSSDRTIKDYSENIWHIKPL